ncbi:MAG: Coenzyme F420 hydrogenase/dehydrogenase, beta subunit C-terminal domain [Ignavibacteriae bacterium]|nr:Coenzyme F420 hydrogenase/dehydrogenase, beta subunit C-terminal domain [Ignavibacteriota bacterium]
MQDSNPNFVDGNSLKKIDKKKLSIAFTNKNLCTRSGTCVGACPEKALVIGKDFYPEINEDLCTSCGICADICPGEKVNFKELTEITFGHSNDADTFDGEVIKTVVGYSSDNRIRGGGAGGGVITGLLWDLLKRKVVDGCIVTRMNPNKPYYGEVYIARTYEELLESQQSKYIVIPVNEVFKEIRDLPGKYAMAALPCQIHGIRLMEKIKDPVVQKIELVIGLFCAAAMEPFVALEMMEMKNVDPNDITTFNFREGSWPGHIRATLKSGEKVNMHYSNFKDGAINYMTQLYSPFRCQTCIDGSSEFSDISVSDAWTRDETGKYIFESQSKMLIRTEKGLRALNNAVAAGSLVVEDVTKNKNYQTHKLHRRKKGLKTPLRVERLKAKGIPVPIYDRAVPKPTLRESFEERLETFVMMCGHHRIIRYPLYKFLTSKWGVPFIKLRQYNKSKKYRRK